LGVPLFSGINSAKQAGKKEGGWGEGIFARLLPFPFRLSKGKAEGGVGGNSAFPLRNQNEASPATCLNTWKAEHHRKILFSLKEKEIGRAQNEKSKEYFSVVWRACRAVAGLASLLGVLLKKSSNINQKTPPRRSRAPWLRQHVDGATMFARCIKFRNNLRSSHLLSCCPV